MSVLISAASPDLNGWRYDVKSDLEDNEYPPAEKLTWLSQIMETHYYFIHKSFIQHRLE